MAIFIFFISTYSFSVFHKYFHYKCSFYERYFSIEVWSMIFIAKLLGPDGVYIPGFYILWQIAQCTNYFNMDTWEMRSNRDT